MTRWFRIPPLFRFLGLNCAAGIAASWLFLAGIVWLDVGGLGGMLANSPDRYVALGLLLGGFAVTFGSAAMATAVWLMPYGEGGSGTTVRMKPAAPEIGGAVPVRSARAGSRPGMAIQP